MQSAPSFIELPPDASDPDDARGTENPASLDEARAPLSSTPEATARLRTVVMAHHALVWRTARRFGVPESRVDEAVSRVFDIVTRRLPDILPGREQAFVVQTCVRVASELRRAVARRAKFEGPLEDVEGIVSDAPSPEELLDQQQARALLDEALDALDEDTRIVFVLHELEGWTSMAIAESLNIAAGTAASRLRRGRQQFDRAAARLRQRLLASDRPMQKGVR
ncbi:MAG: hypothetical protein BGO98_37730 [Myxococcales bacterium 68-20]|nr:sigma-70 family RNA polymerase sigma factor [Myxococcales bacterium]OJY22327.1 MAG: hypothetical protein BGO98_37730 [Myxococcales bacterium 68-20]